MATTDPPASGSTTATPSVYRFVSGGARRRFWTRCLNALIKLLLRRLASSFSFKFRFRNLYKNRPQSSWKVLWWGGVLGNSWESQGNFWENSEEVFSGEGTSCSASLSWGTLGNPCYNGTGGLTMVYLAVYTSFDVISKSKFKSYSELALPSNHKLCSLWVGFIDLKHLNSFLVTATKYISIF
jgi:hypothetical protein